MPDFPFDLSKLNLSSIMDMANDLKDKMAQMENSLAGVVVESVVGGGMVKVSANGKGEIVRVSIEDELVAMHDREMLESLVLSCANKALAEAKKRREEEMKKLTGGLGVPGWLA